MSTVIRTCIGCRERADKTTLLRLVAVRTSSDWMINPDSDGSQPGRGAHLHPTQRCLELALRRKAFGRALKIGGAVQIDLVRAAIQDRTEQKN